jgi:hypothetical protein
MVYQAKILKNLISGWENFKERYENAKSPTANNLPGVKKFTQEVRSSIDTSNYSQWQQEMMDTVSSIQEWQKAQYYRNFSLSLDINFYFKVLIFSQVALLLFIVLALI